MVLDNMPWQYDTMPMYRLSRTRLEAGLRALFGNYDFNIEVGRL